MQRLHFNRGHFPGSASARMAAASFARAAHQDRVRVDLYGVRHFPQSGPPFLLSHCPLLRALRGGRGLRPVHGKGAAKPDSRPRRPPAGQRLRRLRTLLGPFAPLPPFLTDAFLHLDIVAKCLDVVAKPVAKLLSCWMTSPRRSISATISSDDACRY